MEPYIRTSITDRIHDGLYDIDVAHKATLSGRVLQGKDGNIRTLDISCGGKQCPLGRGVVPSLKVGSEGLLYYVVKTRSRAE